MKKLLCILGIILVPFTLQAQNAHDNLIKKSDVAGIIKTLNSNKMKGRNAFSPSIWKAANFIAGKFNKFGLQPLDGQDDYLQMFTMYSVSTAEAQITVDGKKLPDKDYFAVVNGQDISWTPDDGITIKQINEGDSFRDELRGVFRSKKNLIVFVDTSFSKMFHRFKPFFSRPSRTFDKSKESNKVFILGKKANQFHIVLNKKVDKTELANVAGRIVGKRKNEIVVFSAHYDHLGVAANPVNGDRIYNGANDDASGTTAVIELAKYFSHQKQPVRTIIFVAFTAEEEGGYGSKYFSEHINPDHIMAMLNIEMIGKPSAKGTHSAWITGFDKSSLGKILQENSKDINFTFFPCPYPNKNLFYRSDNATLARLGVPAHSISTTQIVKDPDYHQVTDEFSTLSMETVTNTIRAIAHASQGIISGEDTPTRVDPKTVH